MGSAGEFPAAGSYGAAWEFVPKDSGAYAVATGTAEIKVLPAEISGAVIKLVKPAVHFSGEPHSADIESVTLNGKTLTEGEDFTIPALPAEVVNAGEYPVTITGKGNYTGSATVTFTVNKVGTQPIETEDGKQLQIAVEEGLSEVPSELSTIEEFNTTEKIEDALRVEITKEIPSAGENVSVIEVELQIYNGTKW